MYSKQYSPHPKFQKFHQLQYLVAFLFLMPLILTLPKGTISIAVNSSYNIFSDLFFKYITNLGHGVVFGVAVLILLFYKYSYSLIMLLAGLMHGLIVHYCKNYVFSEMARPTAFFSNPDVLHFVDGVAVHATRSFPSGHTATAFAFAFLLPMMLPKKRLSFILFTFAVLTAYSRIYLLQHFFIDTYFGALIGIGTSWAIWQFFEKTPAIKNSRALNSSLTKDFDLDKKLPILFWKNQ
ncbi:phosphatase PAP2 family protein [Flammeovirgaceae bacterium SG7u.111]|nr:phosphatase PAP2 family protein [Flammeovirgaceae bacterium SG7u.132]WPO34278.1 phosphatase PAP2 family protein [Flammeovirgaceae bacterium SG7u.111]